MCLGISLKLFRVKAYGVSNFEMVRKNSTWVKRLMNLRTKYSGVPFPTFLLVSQVVLKFEIYQIKRLTKNEKKRITTNL